jgi:hypothetical protein
MVLNPPTEQKKIVRSSLIIWAFEKKRGLSQTLWPDNCSKPLANQKEDLSTSSQNFSTTFAMVSTKFFLLVGRHWIPHLELMIIIADIVTDHEPRQGAAFLPHLWHLTFEVYRMPGSLQAFKTK